MIRLLASCILLLSSCNAAHNKASKQLIQETIPFQILAQDTYGGYTDSKFLVIEDNKSLTEVFNLLNKSRSPELEIPAINLKKETVIALFLGEKTSGGYAITVKQVLVKSNKIYIVYNVESPKGGDIVTSVMTQPFSIIKIPKTAKEIVFEKMNY
ncbi:MAG: protease complex subunit PrcB family protein [Chlorobi bacterium]|nr:protease complex subunit PrcB family protein [Chlorobiota bacterium]